MLLLYDQLTLLSYRPLGQRSVKDYAEAADFTYDYAELALDFSPRRFFAPSNSSEVPNYHQLPNCATSVLHFGLGYVRPDCRLFRTLESKRGIRFANNHTPAALKL